MSLLRALVLGVLQGATEFVPVSSSGHLVLVPWLLGWENPGLTFDVVVHLGTLLAVLAVFWRDVIRLVAAWFRSLRGGEVGTDAKIAWFIIIGSIPAAILGFLFEDVLEQAFAAPRWVAAFLLVTGVILALSEAAGRRTRGFPAMRWLDALLIGLAQAVAMLPGVSRSGSTIAAGLGRNLERDVAARFSFLLAIPVVAGAGLFTLLDWAEAPGLNGASAGALAVGFLAAAVSGYVCIRFLLSYLRRHSLLPFAIYCWAFGLLALLAGWLGWRA